MEKWVNVLISTYNGEKYISKQIDSILKQTYPNIRIYVRDDGSKDSTVSLIKKKYPMVQVSIGENVGHGRSFYQLTEQANTGDYWAYSDQDDYWYPEKIEWAVEWMEKQDKKEPLLFHSAYRMVDESLQIECGRNTPPKYEIDFRRTITDSVYQGFSIVINDNLRELFLKCGSQIVSHDWLLGEIVTLYGKACFDKRIASDHRRLDGSQSGMTWQNRVKWFKKTLSGESDIKSTAKVFYREFSKTDKNNKKELQMIYWFTHDGYSRDTWKKLFYPGRWRSSFLSELSLRTLILLGKI